MRIRAKKQFSSNYVGNIMPGKVLAVPDDVPEHVALHFIEYDLCEVVMAAGAKPAPLASGPSSQSSPAGQALPSNSVNTSASDGSKAPAGSSQSTPVTNESLGVTGSTRQTARGGKSTTRKPRKTAKK